MTLDNEEQQQIILNALNGLAASVGQKGIAAETQDGRRASQVYAQIAGIYEDVEAAEIDEDDNKKDE